MIWLVALLGLLAGGLAAFTVAWLVLEHASTPH